MAVMQRCPDATSLEALALGRMEPEEVELLAQHCETCERCIHVLQQLRAEDPLVETMRAGATAATSPLPEQLEGLIHRLKSLYRFGDVTVGDAGSFASGDSGLSAFESHHTEEQDDFLAPPQTPGELGRLGAYRVLKVLGAGGMGVVFLAEEPDLERLVALKVMKPALAASATARKRFMREAQAIAAVQHDHIIHINQIGQAGDIPFLAMPYLQGETLEDRLHREGRLPWQEVVRIGREIAEGLSAAHERGLVHRDVKPPNVWLEGQRGRVKILDFGLVRAVSDEANLTQPGAIAGTPAYMAPEQAHGENIDHRADLFGLGCVLYRMTTGERPFRGRNPLQTLRSVERDQPRPIDELRPDVPRELSSLVARLLAKDPEDRPSTTEEVIQTLREIEEGRPSSRPAEALAPDDRLTSTRRGRIGWFLAVLVLLMTPLAWFFTGTVIRFLSDQGELVIETDAQDIEVTIRGDQAVVHDKAKGRRFVLTTGEYEVEVREEGDDGIRLATRKFAIIRGGRETFHAKLAPSVRNTNRVIPRERPDPPPVASATGSFLDVLNPNDIPAPERFEWQPKELVAVFGEHAATHWGEVHAIAVSPRGETLASGGADAVIHLSNASLQLIGTLAGHEGPVYSLAFVNRSRLLSAGADGTIRLWDVQARREVGKLIGHQGRVLTVAVSPDGTRALSGGDDATIRLWDLVAGKELRMFEKSRSAVWKIVLDGAGKRVLSGGDDRSMRFWDLETGTDLVQFEIEKPGQYEFRAITLSADGSRAFSGTTEGNGIFSSMRVWDTATGQEVRRTHGPIHRVTHYGHGVEITIANAVARSPDGNTVLTGIHSPADGNELILWDLHTGNVIRRFGPQATRAGAVAFSPDGRRAYSGSRYGRLRVWDVETGQDLTMPFDGHESFVSSVALAPDGQSLLTAGEDLAVRLWKTTAPQRQLRVYQATHPETAYCTPWHARFTPQGDQALFFGGVYTGHFAQLWELGNWQLSEELKVPTDVSLASRLFLPDGRQLLSKFETGLTIHDGFTGLTLLDRQHAVYSGHERNVPATRRGSPVVQLWDIEQDRILKTITAYQNFMGVTASEDTIAVTQLSNGAVRLYDSTLEERHDLGPGIGPAMAFSPDGATFATANAHGHIVLWSPRTGQKLHKWKFPGQVFALGFDSTGRYLVTGNANGTAYLLRLPEPEDHRAVPHDLSLL